MSPGYYIYKCLEQRDSWRREDLSDAIGGLQSSPAGETKCIAWEKTCSARKLANCMKRTVCLWQSRFQENHSCEKRSYSVMRLFTWKAKQESKSDSVVPCSLSCHQFRNRVRHMMWSAFCTKGDWICFGLMACAFVQSPLPHQATSERRLVIEPKRTLAHSYLPRSAGRTAGLFSLFVWMHFPRYLLKNFLPVRWHLYDASKEHLSSRYQNLVPVAGWGLIPVLWPKGSRSLRTRKR